jgi:non-homologous end joining protein Ku
MVEPDFDVPEPSTAELKMAAKLIDMMKADPAREDFRTEDTEKVMAALSALISGEELKETKAEEQLDPTGDVLDSLRLSVLQMSPPSRKKVSA